jgi:hypothetical protein
LQHGAPPAGVARAPLPTALQDLIQVLIARQKKFWLNTDTAEPFRAHTIQVLRDLARRGATKVAAQAALAALPVSDDGGIDAAGKELRQVVQLNEEIASERPHVLEMALYQRGRAQTQYGPSFVSDSDDDAQSFSPTSYSSFSPSDTSSQPERYACVVPDDHEDLFHAMVFAHHTQSRGLMVELAEHAHEFAERRLYAHHPGSPALMLAEIFAEAKQQNSAARQNDLHSLTLTHRNWTVCATKAALQKSTTAYEYGLLIRHATLTTKLLLTVVSRFRHLPESAGKAELIRAVLRLPQADDEIRARLKVLRYNQNLPKIRKRRRFTAYAVCPS